MQRRIGDVCISWENEAFRAIDKLGADKFEMVTPSVSILTEPPVAVVDKVVQRRGTERVARLSRIPVFKRRPGNRRPPSFPPARSRRGGPYARLWEYQSGEFLGDESDVDEDHDQGPQSRLAAAT